MEIMIYYPFEPEQIEAFRHVAKQHGEHRVHHVSSDEEAIQVAPNVEVILGRFPPAVCAAAPKLRWIQSFSTGMDKFLFDEIVARDEVRISNVAGLYASQGGEHAWALLLALTRQIPLAVHNKDRKKWSSEQVIELAGTTMGVIGMGGFGMEIAKRAQGYDMQVIAIDPVRTDKPDYVDELRETSKENLFDLLHRSDVVMMACPLTKETYHLIGAEELAAMKQGSYLINVTRGGIIDEPALIDALESDHLAGAGLDVCEVEPLPEDNPLWDAPNLILTPHRAGASQHRPRKVFEFFLENLGHYLSNGEPQRLINKQRGF